MIHFLEKVTLLFLSPLSQIKLQDQVKISFIRVGSHKYEGTTEPDGFYHSMHNLKHPDMLYIHNSPHYQSVLVDYENIVRILKLSEYIPVISAGESADILYSVRTEVNDFFSITSNHFIMKVFPA